MVGAIVLSLFGVIFIGVLGVVLLRKGRTLLRSASSLRRQGVVVEGHVDGRDTGSGGRGSRWYYLNYSYEYDGKSYSRMQPVWHNYYTAHDVGTALPVRCLPGNPAEAELVEDDFGGQSNIGYIIGGVCLIGIGIFGLAIIIIFLFADVNH